MAKAYQYDASGYFVGEVEDYGGPLPNNSTRTVPEVRNGYIPHWMGTAGEQVENHKGKEGYVGGKSFTVKEYGPLPNGWSDTPPEPTQKEKDAQLKTQILARLKEIDLVSVRPLRAMANGEAAQEDKDKLTELDAEAQTLRTELAILLG